MSAPNTAPASKTSPQPQITLSAHTIHNPAEPRHFMRVKPVAALVRIVCDGEVLAETTQALRVIEAGRDLYDPVFYFPRNDVTGRLQPASKDRTHCPLKGQASYFDLPGEEGREPVGLIAWSYDETYDFASELKGLIAFDAAKVSMEQHPLPPTKHAA